MKIFTENSTLISSFKFSGLLVQKRKHKVWSQFYAALHRNEINFVINFGVIYFGGGH